MSHRLDRDGPAIGEWGDIIPPEFSIPSAHQYPPEHITVSETFDPGLDNILTVPHDALQNMRPQACDPSAYEAEHRSLNLGLLSLNNNSNNQLVNTTGTTNTLVTPTQPSVLSETVPTNGNDGSAVTETVPDEGYLSESAQSSELLHSPEENPSEDLNRISIDSTGSSWCIVDTEPEPPTNADTATVPVSPSGKALIWVNENPGQVCPRDKTQAQPRQQKLRGKFEDEELRKETGQTRHTMACIRCRMQKIRVPTPHSLMAKCRTDCR